MNNKPAVTAATILAVLLAPTAVSAFDVDANASVGCDRAGQISLTNLTTQAFIDARPDDGTWFHDYTVVGQGVATADVGQTVQVPITAQPGDVLTVVTKWSDSSMTETSTVTVTGPTDAECAPTPPPPPTVPEPEVFIERDGRLPQVSPAPIVPPAPPTLPVTGTGTASIAAALGTVLLGAGTWMVRATSRA